MKLEEPTTLAPPRPSRPRAGRPPGPGGHPLLGSLRELRADPLRLFAESAAQYGDIVRFRAVHRPVYLVVGGELIARIGVHNRSNYVKGVSYDALRVPIGDALLTADGEVWRSRRRLLQPLFGRRALHDHVPAIAAAVEGLGRRWDRLADSGAALNVASEMNRLTFDVVGRVLMGTELGEEMPDLEPRIAEASGWVAHRTRALVPLPPSLPTARNRDYRRAEAAIRRFADGLVAARREQGGGGMVARLVAARDEAGLGMSPTALRDEVIGFLMAGHQTTGAALTWTWYLLAHHPDVAERLAAETAAVLGGAAPGPAELERLPYVGQVLDETMRLYPPGWAFTRTPLADDVLGGCRIGAGAVLVISSYANQRNPRFWEDPERFAPERFAPERPAPDPYHYFPFGIGPHACVGKHLALLEANVAMAILAQRFRLELLDPAPVRPEPAITLTPRDPVVARVHRRPG